MARSQYVCMVKYETYEAHVGLFLKPSLGIKLSLFFCFFQVVFVPESLRVPASGTGCGASSVPIGLSYFCHCLRKSFSVNMKLEVQS